MASIPPLPRFNSFMVQLRANNYEQMNNLFTGFNSFMVQLRAVYSRQMFLLIISVITLVQNYIFLITSSRPTMLRLPAGFDDCTNGGDISYLAANSISTLLSSVRLPLLRQLTTYYPTHF